MRTLVDGVGASKTTITARISLINTADPLLPQMSKVSLN